MAQFEVENSNEILITLDSSDSGTDTLEIPDKPEYGSIKNHIKKVFICNSDRIPIKRLIFPSCMQLFRAGFLVCNTQETPIEHIEFRADNIFLESNYTKGSSAFDSIKGSLKTIKISGRNPYFEGFTFCDFDKLERVEFEQDPLKVLDGHVFAGCSNLDITCLLKEGLSEIAYNALAGCNAYNKRIILPETLQTIASDSFNGVKNLREVEFSGVGLSVFLNKERLFEGENSVDFFLNHYTEIATDCLGANVKIIRKPPCEKDKAINSLRSKFSLLTGEDSGFISYGVHNPSSRQKVLNLIPDKYLEDAMVDLINKSYHPYVTDWKMHHTMVMLDYKGLRISVDFYIDTLSEDGIPSHFTNKHILETKIFKGFYLVYVYLGYLRECIVIAFPISKDLLLKSGFGYRVYEQEHGKGEVFSSIQINAAGFMASGLSDILDIQTKGKSSIVTFLTKSRGNISYDVDNGY